MQLMSMELLYCIRHDAGGVQYIVKDHPRVDSNREIHIEKRS